MNILIVTKYRKIGEDYRDTLKERFEMVNFSCLTLETFLVAEHSEIDLVIVPDYFDFSGTQVYRFSQKVKQIDIASIMDLRDQFDMDELVEVIHEFVLGYTGQLPPEELVKSNRPKLIGSAIGMLLMLLLPIVTVAQHYVPRRPLLLEEELNSPIPESIKRIRDTALTVWYNPTTKLFILQVGSLPYTKGYDGNYERFFIDPKVLDYRKCEPINYRWQETEDLDNRVQMSDSNALKDRYRKHFAEVDKFYTELLRKRKYSYDSVHNFHPIRPPFFTDSTRQLNPKTNK